MSDLDRIAVNDMKHELCDISPCVECTKRLRFTVTLTNDQMWHLKNTLSIQIYRLQNAMVEREDAGKSIGHLEKEIAFTQRLKSTLAQAKAKS